MKYLVAFLLIQLIALTAVWLGLLILTSVGAMNYDVVWTAYPVGFVLGFAAWIVWAVRARE